MLSRLPLLLSACWLALMPAPALPDSFPSPTAGGVSASDVDAKINAAMGSLPSPYTDAKAAAASPVQSVNGQIGAVTVPAFRRQIGTVTTFTQYSGWVSGTLPFGTPFSQNPGCSYSFRTADRTVTFTVPETSALSPTSITVTFRVQPLTVNVLTLGASVALSAGTIPSDLALDIQCIAPL